MYDIAILWAWIEFAVRWLHVITAIAWIGSSFYFIALDLGLNRDIAGPADGEEWQVHRRYSRPDMPETLQVGMVTYTDWEKANDFDPFYQNSNALTPDGFDPTPGQAFNPDLVAGFDYARYVSLNVRNLWTESTCSTTQQTNNS